MKVFGSSIEDVHFLSAILQDSILDSWNFHYQKNLLTFQVNRLLKEDNSKDRVLSEISIYHINSMFRKKNKIPRFIVLVGIICTSFFRLKMIFSHNFEIDLILNKIKITIEDKKYITPLDHQYIAYFNFSQT